MMKLSSIDTIIDSFVNAMQSAHTACIATKQDTYVVYTVYGFEPRLCLDGDKPFEVVSLSTMKNPLFDADAEQEKTKNNLNQLMLRMINLTQASSRISYIRDIVFSKKYQIDKAYFTDDEIALMLHHSSSHTLPWHVCARMSCDYVLSGENHGLAQ